MTGPSADSATLHFRLLNVFTTNDVQADDAEPAEGGGGAAFSGNPLCVFEDACTLSTEQMQAIARQFNLSETTFVQVADPPPGVSAVVRVFTPTIELPFAGHPTLGTAHVVRDLTGAGDDVVLRMPAADVPVHARGNFWTLTAKAPATREVSATRDELAGMLGVTRDAVLDGALWVDTGVEQLIVPLRSVDDVRDAQADAARLVEHGMSPAGEALVYLWAPISEEAIEARLFFSQDRAVVEDPATGSACANLGGWFHARGSRGLRRRITQGAAVQRPSVLRLEVDEAGSIFVGGAVRELGRGTIQL